MGGLVSFSSYGNFNRTERFLKKIKTSEIFSVLDEYGAKGCEILSSLTPKRTGATASSWSYKCEKRGASYTLSWLNSRLADDGKTPLVVLIINGHGTGWGGYVPPNDFVTKPMRDLCKEAADAVWKVVKTS